MIVPPVPHTLGYKGGYLTYELRKGITHGSWDNIKREDIVDGMNAIQATEWAIRERVLEVAEYLLEPYMQARDTNEYAHNTSLRIAREYVGMPLWMPTYCDFRGRILEQPEPLSYQGNDLNRGTLTFHEEVDITDEGLPWLFVHVANTCSGLPVAKGIKLDKLPFEDRVIWVRDNIRVLLDIAQDPYGNKDLYWDGFGKGAKTFQALASCDELYKVVTTNKTSIPCVGDGTQNNYQWSAGLIRDKDLAGLVNLLPCSIPNDLHQAVGDANREAWEAGESDHEYMPEFLERADVLCDRGTVKPASMVIGYNGTARGIGKHLLGKKAWENTGTDDEPSWVLVAHQDSALNGIDIPLEEHSKASFCLAQDYEKAVYKVAPSAKEVSNFVTACVDVANDNGQPMKWQSPSGIVVINRPTTREEFTLHGANCWLDQTCTQLKFGVFTDELDKRKARTSAPPNLTHSLDGSHMAISCKRFVLEVKGICLPDEKVAIASIMDCYGTHANRVPMFRKIIINTFVDILMLDPLKALADSYSVELPAYGELDLEETRQAEYLLG
jgi:DNA-directed RNA polymerase